MNNQAMCDLETMDSGPRSAIMSIGMCAFDPFTDKPITNTFQVKVRLESSMAHGLTISASTVEWWLGQSREAQSALLEGDRCNLDAAIRSCDYWLRTHQITDVWGNGATFDNVVLRNAYKATGYDPSWSFRNDRCYRTVCNLLSLSQMQAVGDIVRIGTFHDARDDALTQAYHLRKVFKALGIKEF